MVSKIRSRRSELEELQKQVEEEEDSFFRDRCRAILRGELIPVLGDTIRISHIFDVNNDQVLCVAGEHVAEAQDTSGDDAENENCVQQHELNIAEQLTKHWANEINYPLKDDHLIERVAQFNQLTNKDPRTANERYLKFLKETLLEVAADLWEKDDEQLAFLNQLSQEPLLTFSDIVTELDFPLFPEGREDPLRILARLPLRIYITTSCHDFIERELEAAGKRPRSRLCFWWMQPDSVPIEQQEELNTDNPLVYHLFGMEQYPESLVFSEDDYLNLLWALAKDLPGDSGKRIIPPFLENELRNSSLLLLGYRLQDWDLGVLFHGLLKGGRGLAGTAIHLDLKEQPLVKDEKDAEFYLERATRYLDKYFGQAGLDVRIGKSDEFVTTLWNEWDAFR